MAVGWAERATSVAPRLRLGWLRCAKIVSGSGRYEWPSACVCVRCVAKRGVRRRRERCLFAMEFDGFKKTHHGRAAFAPRINSIRNAHDVIEDQPTGPESETLTVEPRSVRPRPRYGR